MVINYKGNMKWYLDNHITWLQNDDINYSKGNMEDELNKGSAWRMSGEDADGAEITQDDYEEWEKEKKHIPEKAKFFRIIPPGTESDPPCNVESKEPNKYLTEEEAIDMVRKAVLVVENNYMLMETDAMHIIKRIFHGI